MNLEKNKRKLYWYFLIINNLVFVVRIIFFVYKECCRKFFSAFTSVSFSCPKQESLFKSPKQESLSGIAVLRWLVRCLEVRLLVGPLTK
ncbi:hypothetical protein PGB90_007959 [Kerria lacca]